jgi:regulator of sirC expression with transglutaminase-like and TPR domain
MARTLADRPQARELLERAFESTPHRLDWAALAIALLEYPNLDLAAQEQKLDALAVRVRASAEDSLDIHGKLGALRRVLGDEEGFRGDMLTYASAENSFLNQTLERRMGLPITLSVLYLEVARRSGVPLFGVPFPGHFVVAAQAPEGKVVLDPFQGGAVLTEAGLAALLVGVAPQVKFSPTMVAAATVKAITVRMLMNLKRTYQTQADHERMLRVLDLLLMLSPDHPGELRARAQVLSSLGAYRAALEDVERCLELSPRAPDHVSLLLAASSLRHRVEHLN